MTAQRRIHRRMTPAKRAWLEKLLREGPQERTSKTGYYCMQLGWTEWAYDAHGNIIGDKITDAGIRALRGELS